jgi:tRNA 2-thiouridine synthesizing protein A
MGREVLDVRGKICPVPLLLTKRRLEAMRNGEVLEVIGDYPQTRDNIQKLVQRTGSETLKIEESVGEFRILIRKNTLKAENEVHEEDLSCTPSKKEARNEAE